MRLTDEGLRFWERVGPHLDGIEAAALDAAGSVQAVRGRLRMNVDPFFSRWVLSRELARFLALHRAAKVRAFTEWCLQLLGGDNDLDAAGTH
ncbi:hypothetical protein [Methylobacterium sp. J-026]|uniref:hypothetical protein n=1 Tax=Methylobacterium sp. J-026 TaxID=2836624 RepID=UPI00391C06EE